jgi:hypothetical protein
MNTIKSRYGLLFVCMLSVLLSLMYIPPYDIPCGDKEVYRYVGRVMLRGGVPYRDVFDHKPPLIFFLNYAALLAGGNWALWIIDTCLVVLATGMFYSLCKKYRFSFPWILPLLFNLMLRDFMMSLGMGMTREYTTILQMIFFCVLLGKYRYRYFILGLLSGLIFFMQQDQVLALVPFFIYTFLPGEDALPVVSRILRTTAGFLAIALPVLLYFVVSGSIVYFWQDAFVFNMTWYTTTLKESFGDHLRKLKSTLDKGNYEMPFMVAMTLAFCSLYFQTKKKGFIIVCLAAVVLSIIPEFMGGRDITPKLELLSFSHYFLPLSATLSLVIFAVFAFTQEPSLQGWKAQLVFGALTCTSLLYTAIQHGTHLTAAKESGRFVEPQFDYLRPHPPGDYQLFIFGSTGAMYAYNEFKIIGPSKWVYQHFYYLYDRWDQDNTILYSIQQDLLRHKTSYIFDLAKKNLFLDPAKYDLWRSFLRQHYEQVDLASDTSECILWKLKGSAK